MSGLKECAERFLCQVQRTALFPPIIYFTIRSISPTLRSGLSPVADRLANRHPRHFPSTAPKARRHLRGQPLRDRPRNSQSRVVYRECATIRSAISLLSGAHNRYCSTYRLEPRKLGKLLWSPRPLKPIASRKQQRTYTRPASPDAQALWLWANRKPITLVQATMVAKLFGVSVDEITRDREIV